MADIRPKVQTTISACLIVKNEEANLARCLGSIAPAVDELVVVDTGSTDRTVAIAEELGAQVFHFDWCDDFSAARNESLRHATGDWIIWVDGDDELVELQPGSLRRLCGAQPGPDWGYWVDVRSPYGFTPDEEVTVRHWRVFRNRKGIQFRGRIHEEPWPPQSIRREQIDTQSAIRIDHWGYLPDGKVLQQKSARNRRLLAQCLRDEPWRPIHYYNMGRHCIREGDDRSALEILLQGYELWDSQGRPEWASAHSLLAFAAQAALSLGQLEKVLEIEAQTPDDLISAELLCNAGIALWKLDRREEAIVRLNRARQDPAVAKSQIHDLSKSTWHPLLMLSGLYDQTGDTTQAYNCATRALEFAPSHPEVLLAAGYLADRLGTRSESVAWLRKLLAGDRDDGFKAQGRHLLLIIAEQTDQPELMLEALSGEVHGVSPEECALRRAQAHRQMGDLQASYDTLERAAREFPNNPTIRLSLAELLAGQGYADEAITILGQALDCPEAPPEVYQLLGKLLAKQGRLDDAANALTMAVEVLQARHAAPAVAVS